MKIKTIAEKNNRAAKIGKRSVSVLLAALLVIGTFAVIPFVTNADDVLVKNYPLLREVGETGPNGDNWSYSVHDYAEKPDFKTSDTNFTAPAVEIKGNGAVKLSWKAFGSADSYTVNVYDSTNKLSYENKNVTATELEIDSAEFTEGEYQVQLIAFKGGSELSASMVRPFEYKAAVTEADLLTDLGGNIQSGGGRSEANTTDDADALNRAPVSRLHAHTLNKSACFWFNSIATVPQGTQALAFWYSQKFPEDDSYYALRFQFAWQTISVPLAATKQFHFIPANSTDKIHTTGTDNAGYSSLDSNGKNGEYIEGWVVVPLSNYTDAAKNTLMSTANLNLRIYWATAKTLVKADGSTDKTATNGDSRRHYVSNLHAVSDLEAFLELYKTPVDTSYAASAQTDYECDTYSADKEYYNQNSPANKYTIGANSVSFTLTDDAVGTKGMQLTFTAPESGYYDLSQKLAVTGNASAVGNIYYRVVNGGEKLTVYPTDSQWLTLAVNGTNPTAKLNAATTYLKEGETLTLEAYADLTAGGSVKIDIGNPVTTLTEYTYAGAGEYLSYSAFDYFPSVRDMTTPYYINDRFEFYMLNYTSSLESPTVIEFTKYNKAWSNYMYYNDNTEIIGLLGMHDYPEGEHLKFKGVDNHAPQITYNVTEDGTLSMEIPVRMQIGDIDVRVTKNNDQIWPLEGFYTVKTGETVNISTDIDVAAGDKVNIQFYTSSPDVVEGYTDPVFSQSVTPKGNSSTVNIYSPLWERPYSFDSDYIGEYSETPAALFSFGITAGGNATVMDSYDASKGNYLYSTAYPASGFSFGKDDLTFAVSDKAAGMSIAFTAPHTGKYDISSALKVVSGAGVASYKITADGKILYSSEFNASAGYVLDIPACFVELNVGEKIEMVLTATLESSDPIVVNLGTPVICCFANYTYSGSETTDIYTPDCFTAFEEGKVSTRLPANARFEYILKSGSKEAYADTYNTAEKSVTYNSTGFKLSDTGALTVDIKDTSYVHTLRFTAPKDISGKLQFELSSAAAAEVSVTKNGTQIGKYTANSTSTPIALDIALAEGDIIEWNVKSQTACEVSLGVPNITDVFHVTDYDSTTASYNALAGNPFGDEAYTGYYKRYDNEYWLYDIAEITADGVEYIIPDSYDSSQNNYLYSSNTENGYYFEDTLNVTLKDTADGKYGISLGFAVPRTDSFIFRTGLRIVTEGATAKLYIRIIKNGETVWCGDGADWFGDSAVTGMDVDIPLQLLDLAEGDMLRFEVYAEEITVDSQTAEEIKLALVSPELLAEASKIVKHDDITATVVYPYDEFQYRNAVYTGEYIPMENRWNYEFAVFGDTAEFFAPDYYSGKTVDLYSSEYTDSPHYLLKTNQYKLTPAAENAKGISLRYTSAVETETIFRLMPTIASGADKANVKYRVLHNDTVIWPTAESGEEWETLTADSPESEIDNRLYLDLKVGDNVYVQFYAEPTADEIADVTVSMNAFAGAVSFKKTSKNAYATFNANTSPVQLSPFWAYEYAMEPDNIVWELAESYANGYYNMGSAGYCGVNGQLPLFGLTNAGTFQEFTKNTRKVPIVAITLTAPQTGFYRLDNGAISLYSTQDVPAKARITVNNEKVWPTDSDWVEVGTTPINDYANMSFELKEGDKLRFEVTAAVDYDTFITLERFRIRWPVTVSYSLFDLVYTDTNDIFNMLTPEMLEFYKKLAAAGGGIFDENPEYWLTQSIFGDGLGGNTGDSTLNNSGSDGYYVEGTEDQVVVTKGKRRKIIKRYVEEPGGLALWLIILICVVAAVLLIAAVIVIIILHKKGKIKWFKRRRI